MNQRQLKLVVDITREKLRELQKRLEDGVPSDEIATTVILYQDYEAIIAAHNRQIVT